MKRIIFNILFLISSISALKSQENWDVYIARYEDGPGSTVVNMSLREVAPDKKLPFVLITGVTFKDCSPDGFPNKSQWDELYTISDSIKTAIEKSKKNYILAGTFTYQCERLDYYYISDTALVREILSGVYSKYFPDYTAYTSLEEDKNWEAYLNFIYPNEETLEFMENEKVLMSLSNAGDKLNKARQVDHWLYFTTEKERNCFIDYAKKHNYKIESIEKDIGLALPYKLQISKIEKIDIESITKTTLLLKSEAKKCGGKYDGWETFVIKE